MMPNADWFLILRIILLPMINFSFCVYEQFLPCSWASLQPQVQCVPPTLTGKSSGHTTAGVALHTHASLLLAVPGQKKTTKLTNKQHGYCLITIILSESMTVSRRWAMVSTVWSRNSSRMIFWMIASVLIHEWETLLPAMWLHVFCTSKLTPGQH